MASRFLSLMYWIFVSVTALALFPVALFVWGTTALWDPRRAILHRFTSFWASLYTWCSPLWRVEVKGKENIQPGTPYVMVANHSSATDIMVLYRLFTHFKWVSKAENFKVPLIGWNMRLNGYVPLRRGDKASVQTMLEACRALLAQGSSVMMFPEGTRSETPELRPFKTGAFALARTANVPVLPIAILGTREALAKHGWICRPARIRVQVLPAEPPATFAASDLETFAASVRERIGDALTSDGKGRPSLGA
ncbi:MAG: 1-acyl-sn-glycerol-3-phosphate acyltransferase [Myxococcales bacterium]|nr:1-acyl-sn-glycerol-3-phosphate acyltransferase [Myxococcales bacterium]